MYRIWQVSIMLTNCIVLYCIVNYIVFIMFKMPLGGGEQSDYYNAQNKIYFSIHL